MVNKKRTAVQAVATLIQNANFKGFFTGKLYSGAGKNVCVPGLNCYSCPGAVGSCPVGSLQNSLSSLKFRFPYYVLGLLLFFGALLGRIVCGFLCPFGFIQDLLDKIPIKKKIKRFKGDRILRYVKYVVLIVLVIVLPLYKKLTPFFCKYLCPSGTVSGILLAIADSKIVSMFGSRFAWKCCILGIIILASVFIFRPFCKYLCPLGAFYGLFNKHAVFRMKLDAGRCTHCGACENACGMAVKPHENPNSAECIRCGKCIDKCPEGALSLGFALGEKNNEAAGAALKK